MKKFTVLITGVGTATSLCVIKGINRQKTYKVKLVGIDANGFVSGKHFVDKFFTVPLARNPNIFKSVVTGIIKSEKIDLVIPIIDYELPIWSDLSQNPALKDTKILISNKKVLKICQDKQETRKFLESINVPTIKAFESLKTVGGFPVFIKPKKFGRASIDSYKIKNKQQMQLLAAKLKGNFILQEYIQGDEYTADCLSDLGGNFINCVIRKRIEIKGGLSIKAEVVKDQIAHSYCKKILGALKIPGVCNIQFFKKINKYYFFDINPRFAGAHSLTIEAGQNSIKYILDMLSGQINDNLNFNIKYGLKMIRFWEEIIIDKDLVYLPNLLKLND